MAWVMLLVIPETWTDLLAVKSETVGQNMSFVCISSWKPVFLNISSEITHFYPKAVVTDNPVLWQHYDSYPHIAILYVCFIKYPQ